MMSTTEESQNETNDIQDCHRACSTVVRFLTDHQVQAQTATSPVEYTNVDGYRYINVFVKFNQKSSDELPVDLIVAFAFNSSGEMSSAKYVNLEENLPSQQHINSIHISGAGSWNGSPRNTSTYLARLPIMGPFIQVYAENSASITRTVSIWGYLIS